MFLRQRDPFHLLLAATAGVLVLAVVCSQLGMNVSGEQPVAAASGACGFSFVAS